MAGGEDSTKIRHVGKVDRMGSDFGFILSEELKLNNIYFKQAWFRSTPPLGVGDEVTFELKMFDARPQAYAIARTGTDGKDVATLPARIPPANDWLLDWAYLGFIPKMLTDLSALALHERWEFKDAVSDPNRPCPILYGYLLHTFGRLVFEKAKVLVNDTASLAAFNTGLVDHRYEPIYALFGPNGDARASGRAPWRLRAFCIPGEGNDGQHLVRQFNPLPPQAHYFDQPADLLYDTGAAKPDLDWHHVVIERIDRYPKEFLDEHWPAGIERRDTAVMDDGGREAYWKDVGAAIKAQNKLYRAIMNRVRDAVDLSIKRVKWNFKTAVPQYYSKVKRLQLLLPICLVSDDHADIALAVERTQSGTYLGHTVLTLDWAYRNARLICRPDSDWLDAKQIQESGSTEEEA